MPFVIIHWRDVEVIEDLTEARKRAQEMAINTKEDVCLCELWATYEVEIKEVATKSQLI